MDRSKGKSRTFKPRGSVTPRSSRRVARAETSEPTISITPSSGNIFLDMGRSREESANLKTRSELMIELSELIRKRKLTQAQAAKLCGVSQPRVSDLMTGKIGFFSIDLLL